MSEKKIPNLDRLTKAQLIEKIAEMEAKEAETAKLIALDMSFKESPKERSEKEKNQAKKDFIKRMTGGKWTSQEKYEEFLEDQRRKMRM